MFLFANAALIIQIGFIPLLHPWYCDDLFLSDPVKPAGVCIGL